jgi:hypothetical protein
MQGVIQEESYYALFKYFGAYLYPIVKTTMTKYIKTCRKFDNAIDAIDYSEALNFSRDKSSKAYKRYAVRQVKVIRINGKVKRTIAIGKKHIHILSTCISN